MNQAFRDYSTRIAFNMSLTRNQIAAFEYVMLEINHWKNHKCRNGPVNSKLSYFVPAVKRLGEMGLVSHIDPCTMNPPWSKCVWALTPAGEHVWALLIEAGVVHCFLYKAA